MSGAHDLDAGPVPVRVAYDLSAPFYDAWDWQAFWRAHEFPLIKAMLERLRRGRGTPLDLLDVGCGTGWYLENIAQFCGERVGIDVSAGMLAVARHRLRGAQLHLADARNIPFSNARFDAVICTRVLSHLPNVSVAIQEIRRVLMPGGTFILSDVDADHDYEHTRLPIASRKILVDTYKHRRDEVFRSIEAMGFVPGSRYLIFRNGEVREMKRSSQLKIEGIVGWVGSWRSASKVSIRSKVEPEAAARI